MHSNEIFKLDNFEGSFSLLLKRIEEESIEIREISIYSLVNQFSKKLPIPLEVSAELIHGIAYLIWLKSKSLLPKREQNLCIEEDDAPTIDIIQHLLDYSRFKEAALRLSTRQRQQSAHFVRGVPQQIEKIRPPLQLISLEQLANLVQDIMKKAAPVPAGLINEPWQVADKIREIRLLLKQNAEIEFSHLFNSEKTRPELIVIFLALLELMKLGQVKVGEDSLTKNIIIISSIYE